MVISAGYPTVARWNHPERYATSDAAIAEVDEKGQADLDSFFDLMEDGILGEKTFLKSGISALDYYLSLLTEWPADRDRLFSTHPKIAAVYASASERPAYRRAVNNHALPGATA